jgi:NAD(P)-dependent dehydrogenase (short-subunit alcohol dehydrogenase family)
MRPKTILITGASSGIGRALALVYARDGVSLSLIGRDRERLEDTADAARAHGAEVSIGQLDVRDQDAMARWIEAADMRRPFDLVIANAGITTGLAPGAIAEDPYRDQSYRRLEHGRTVDRADVHARGRPNCLRWLDRGLARLALRAFLLRDQGGGPCL